MSAREQAKEYLLWIAWTLGKYKNPLTDTEMQKMYGRSFICIAGREIEISSQRQKKNKNKSHWQFVFTTRWGQSEVNI